MRAFIFILLLAAGGAAIFMLNNRPVEKPYVQRQDLWAGDQETGCMYPITEVTNGKNPIWWSESQRQWNLFPSRTEAESAGYNQCP